MDKLFKNQLNDGLKDLGVVDPQDLVKQLDQYVIGQHKAKKTLALAAFQRSIRMLQQEDIIPYQSPLQKNNVLLLGGTGSGKTYLVKTLAKILNCPITIYDITGTTSAGYVGGNIEDALAMHLINTENFLKKELIKSKENKDFSQLSWVKIVEKYAQLGILYIDEFDKARKIPDRGRDINGESVQQGLLKVLEGEELLFTERENKTRGFNTFNCENLLIICGGAFVGLKDIIKKRKNEKVIGFTSNVEPDIKGNIFDTVTTKDLIEYGFLPEVLGRIPFITSLEKLTVDDLVTILKTAKESVIKEYIDLFAIFGVELVFKDTALKEIAKEAIKRKTGARSLKSIVGAVMEHYQYDIFNLSSSKLVITSKQVLEVFK